MFNVSCWFNNHTYKDTWIDIHFLRHDSKGNTYRTLTQKQTCVKCDYTRVNKEITKLINLHVYIFKP